MEMVSMVLVILIVFEIGALAFWIIRQKRSQPQSVSLRETSKMVRKIQLTNQWENIDDMIGLLRKDSIHISFYLRENNERQDI